MRKIFLAAIAAIFCCATALAQKKPVTLESLNAGRPRAGITPVWSPADDKFIYNEGMS